MNSSSKHPKIANVGLERPYERVQLVRGKGKRRDGRLCIMSFVALLAGERDTDMPKTASDLVQHFAIRLNDGMADGERQRLKPFAPRVIGTRDGLDGDRAELLRRALQDEIAPQLRRDFAEGLPSAWSGRCLTSCAGFNGLEQEVCGRQVEDVCADVVRHGPDRIGAEMARLLVQCASGAASAASHAWYWDRGLDLLDRLCDVGREARASGIGTDQLGRAGTALDEARLFDALSHLVGLAFHDIRHRLRHALSKTADDPGKPDPALHTGLHLH